MTAPPHIIPRRRFVRRHQLGTITPLLVAECNCLAVTFAFLQGQVGVSITSLCPRLDLIPKDALLIVKALHNDVLMDASRLNCNDKKGCCGLIRLRTDFQECGNLEVPTRLFEVHFSAHWSTTICLSRPLIIHGAKTPLCPIFRPFPFTLRNLMYQISITMVTEMGHQALVSCHPLATQYAPKLPILGFMTSQYEVLM